METMLRSQQAQAIMPGTGMDGIQAVDHQDRYPNTRQRKRKAEAQDHNERLSKRLSLLNLGRSAPGPCSSYTTVRATPPSRTASHDRLDPRCLHCTNTIPTSPEHGGQKLYVPVENPRAAASPNFDSVSASSSTVAPNAPAASAAAPVADDDSMHLDDSKYKVYIYNLDDELSSSDAESSDAENGRLVFLPDIDKHLRNTRIPIPKPILPNEDGELAGKQLVLYSAAPSSLTVPEEQDSVRKAIIEARARVRERQREEQEQDSGSKFWSQPMQIPNVPGLDDASAMFDRQQDDPDDDAMELD